MDHASAPAEPSGNRSGVRSVRAFISLALPDSVRTPALSLLASLRRQLEREEIKWAPPHQLHLTLRFLGNVPSNSIPVLTAELERVAGRSPRFELRLDGVGCFPDASRPRVLWLGLGGELAALKELQAAIETCVQPFAGHAEERAFHPHLTLGRARHVSSTGRRTIQEWCRKGQLAVAESTGTVLAFDLMRSELAPSGANHTCLRSFSLLPGSLAAQPGRNS